MEIHDAMPLFCSCDPGIRKKKVLIVDDDFCHLKIISFFLRDFDLELHTATNGLDAIRLAACIPDFDLIVMDIRMPAIDGYEATIEIKKNNPKIPVIIDTALSVGEELKNISLCGCDCYLEKPHTKEQFLNVVEKYLV